MTQHGEQFNEIKSVIEIEEVDMTTQDYGEASVDSDSRTTGVFTRNNNGTENAL